MLLNKVVNLVIANHQIDTWWKPSLIFDLKTHKTCHGVYFQLNKLTINQLYDIEGIINEYSISYVIDLELV